MQASVRTIWCFCPSSTSGFTCFAQTGLPPLISKLSDRGSVFTVGTFRRRNFLPRSQLSQIGGVFLFAGVTFLPCSRHSQIGGCGCGCGCRCPVWFLFAVPLLQGPCVGPLRSETNFLRRTPSTWPALEPTLRVFTVGFFFTCWDSDAQLGFFMVRISSTDLGALRWGEHFLSWDFFTVWISPTNLLSHLFPPLISASQIGGVFSQLRFPPLISVLSDRGISGSGFPNSAPLATPLGLMNNLFLSSICTCASQCQDQLVFLPLLNFRFHVF